MKKKAEGLAPGEIRAIFAHFMECGNVDAARGVLFQYRDIIKEAEKKEAAHDSRT